MTEKNSAIKVLNYGVGVSWCARTQALALNIIGLGLRNSYIQYSNCITKSTKVHSVFHCNVSNTYRYASLISGVHAYIQVNLCQNLLFLHQLTHRLFIVHENCKLRIPAEHVVYTNCCFCFVLTFGTILAIYNMFLRCCELLKKIYL